MGLHKWQHTTNSKASLDTCWREYGSMKSEFYGTEIFLDNDATQAGTANSSLLTIKHVHNGKFQTAKEWGDAQLKRNGEKTWFGKPEIMKYHPERFEANGTPRWI